MGKKRFSRVLAFVLIFVISISAANSFRVNAEEGFVSDTPADNTDSGEDTNEEPVSDDPVDNTDSGEDTNDDPVSDAPVDNDNTDSGEDTNDDPVSDAPVDNDSADSGGDASEDEASETPVVSETPEASETPVPDESDNDDDESDDDDDEPGESEEPSEELDEGDGLIPAEEDVELIVIDEDLISLGGIEHEKLGYRELIAAVFTEEDLLESLTEDDATITVAGNLPEGAYVAAYPVRGLEIETTEGEDEVEVVAAYDITIYSADGEVIQPNETVSVSIDLPAFEELDEVGVYHISGEYNAEPELIADMVAIEGSAVQFEAESFSTFVITISNNHTVSITVNGTNTPLSGTNSSTNSSSPSPRTATFNIDSGGSVEISASDSNSGTISITSVTVAGTEITSSGGKYTQSNITGETVLVINLTRVKNDKNTFYYNVTLTVKIAEPVSGAFPSGSYTFKHIDVKTAAALTEGYASNYSVSKVTSIVYGTTTLTSFSKNGTAEWRATNLNLSGLTQNSTLTITVDMTSSDGNTVVKDLVFQLDKNDVYPANTKYNGDQASKLGTYFGISPVNGYYDISGYSVFLVSAIVCNISGVSYNALSSSGNGYGLDLVLNTKTILEASYALDLDGDKELSGGSITENQFAFTLTETDSSWAVLANGHSQTANCNANGDFTFNPIQYEKLEVPAEGLGYVNRYYIVQEVIPDPIPTGYTYSDWIYYVTVIIGVNATGEVNAKVEYAYSTSSSETAKEANNLVFHNYYDTGSLEISKKVAGEETGSGEYTIHVTTGTVAGSLSAYEGDYYIRYGVDVVTGYTDDGYIIVKAGETIVINGLAYNTFYEVSETVPEGADWKASYSDASGQITNTSTKATVTVINTFFDQEYDVTLNKVGDDGNLLADATFRLWKWDESVSNWVEVVNAYVTDGTNSLLIENLAVETRYMLEETAAPAGYNLLTEYIYLIIGKDGTFTLADEDGATLSGEAVEAGDASWDPTEGAGETLGTLTVVNHAAYSLPEAGGAGTALFYVIGIGIMAGAATLLMLYLKKGKGKKKKI